METCQNVINYLISKQKYTRFLEIGVRENNGVLSINHINCEHKDGVDIMPNRCNYTMTSDKFFKTIPSSRMYDIIFVDGDHERSQVFKDINNCLNHLNEGGVILCHDINPPSEMHLLPRYSHSAWEAWAELRSTRTDLEMYAMNVDLGPGIIRKGNQKIYSDKIKYTWDYLNANRKQLLNEISVDEFKSIFGSK